MVSKGLSCILEDGEDVNSSVPVEPSLFALGVVYSVRKNFSLLDMSHDISLSFS